MVSLAFDSCAPRDDNKLQQRVDVEHDDVAAGGCSRLKKAETIQQLPPQKKRLFIKTRRSEGGGGGCGTIGTRVATLAS